jgi:hypothetical protein
VDNINNKYNNDYISNYSGDEKIDYLLKVSENKYKYILHKIFPHMFGCKFESEDKWIDIINKSKYIIFIKRKFLDIFLSEKKTHITKKYCKIDTSENQIKFNIKEYEMYYKNKYIEWFQKTKQKCIELNKPFIVLDYDIIKNIESREDQIIYCIQKLKQIIDDDLNSFPKEEWHKEWFVKQDNSENYSQKISNYEEVKDFIEDKLQHLNNII